ncbi:hypothetical protein [Rubrivirga sp. IMCC43871]|uniref:hypothetical protein n=1 Tax=Rubrivirga sp. IMCC43871 TaxID=3391575 RepID=UPI0039900A26
MILRRLTQHVQEQNWFAVALEVAIVVVGVFVGLQVSNWNEARQNRALAANYTERLQADLRDEIATMRSASDYFGAVRRHGLAALDAIEQPPDNLDEQFLIDLYQASQEWNLSVRNGTYEELLATGRIDHLANDRTRRLLATYYERAKMRAQTLQDRSDYRQIIREQMAYRIQLAIREQCDDIYTIGEGNSTGFFVSLPEACRVDLAPSLVRQETVRLHASDPVRQALRFQLSILDSRLNSIDNAIRTGGNMLTELTGGHP